MVTLLRAVALCTVFLTCACARPIVGGALSYASLDMLPVPDEVARAAVIPAHTVSGTVGQATIVGPDRVLFAQHCIDSTTPMARLAGHVTALNLVARGHGDQDWAVFDALYPLPAYAPVPLVSRPLRRGEIVFVVVNDRLTASPNVLMGFERRVEPAVVGSVYGPLLRLEGPMTRCGDSGSLVMGYDGSLERWVGVALLVKGAGRQGLIMPFPPELIAGVYAPSPPAPSIDTLARSYLDQLFAHPGIAPEDIPPPSRLPPVRYDITPLLSD